MMILMELGLGARLALGGRSGRWRTALTAVGVALGVAVLLLAASLPHALSARDQRTDARQPVYADRGGHLRLQETDTAFRGRDISGVTLQATGRGAALPPGLARLPAPGQMYVSPALATMLHGATGAELRRRLGARVVGTIGAPGLREPNEALFYRGSDLPARLGVAADVVGFGSRTRSSAGPITILLTIMLLVGLLLPVGVFVLSATRFGAEDRERRLAELRLIGTDVSMTVWVVVGEALLSAGTGLILGAALFLAARPLAQSLDVGGLSVYSSDIRPSAVLAALIVVLIPASSVAATLFGVRRVLANPIAVSRRGRAGARRLWWRLVAPIIGFALLIDLNGRHSQLSSARDEAQAAVGMVFVLIGLITVLPWVVEGIVRRAPDGSVPWLLAIRRLRNEEGTTVRVVGAIALTVAGAIALQMLFAAAQSSLDQSSGGAVGADAVTVTLHASGRKAANIDLAALRRASGARSVLREGFSETDAYTGLPIDARTFTAVFELPGGDAADRLRDRAARIDPLAEIFTVADTTEARTLQGLRRGLAAGAVVVLLMVGASLLVAAAEQLRHRRRALADLAAIGTERSTIAWSVLWQTAIPVVAGLLLAIGLGLGLGAVLSGIVRLSPQFDWGTIAVLAGAAAVVVAAVTVASLPTLWRSMSARPLWTE